MLYKAVWTSTLTIRLRLIRFSVLENCSISIYCKTEKLVVILINCSVNIFLIVQGLNVPKITILCSKFMFHCVRLALKCRNKKIYISNNIYKFQFLDFSEGQVIPLSKFPTTQSNRNVCFRLKRYALLCLACI